MLEELSDIVHLTNNKSEKSPVVSDIKQLLELLFVTKYGQGVRSLGSPPNGRDLSLYFTDRERDFQLEMESYINLLIRLSVSVWSPSLGQLVLLRLVCITNSLHF